MKAHPGAPCTCTSAVNKKSTLLPIDLQGCMASFGLHGLTEPADVTCLHIDRFDSSGRKSHTRLSSYSKVWIPFFVDTKLGIDHIPYQVTAASYHLPSEPTSGHYCTAIFEGGFWWIYDDGNAPVKFTKVPLVVQENCCLVWLNCMPHAGQSRFPCWLRNPQS